MKVLIFCLLFIGCTKNQEKVIIVINNSYKDIWWKIGRSYPDTSLNTENTKWLVGWNTEQIIKLNSRVSSFLSDSKEMWFKENFANDTMMVFIFDDYVMTNLPSEQVKNEYLILKRYDLSLFDLENMNWKITYP